MTLAPARFTALKVLADIRRRDAFSRPVVDAVLARASLSAQDAALASRLVYTAIAAEGVLDQIINEFAKRPGAVEPRVRDALRLSIGEILYLRTPSRAAVHQGVEAVRRSRPAAAGFANAVLRNVADRADAFPWGDPGSDREALARACAMPRWLVDRFLEDLGEAAGTEALLASLEPAPLFVRVNPYRASIEDALAQLDQDGAGPEPYSPDDASIRCGSARNAVRGRAVDAGLVLVSDAAAQVAPLACSPCPGARILDVAAGHGTKTAMLQGIAMLHGGPADITAVDLHAFKLRELDSSLAHLGIPPVTTAVVDASDSDALGTIGADYDIVLVDVPCSGLGTLRRHPEKRWRVRPEDIDRIAGLQRSMLEAAAHVVRPGGLVVYSTCTITRTENERVIGGFLEGETGAFFSVEPLSPIVDDSWQRFIAPEGWFRSWPQRGGADGHFVAALVRSAT